MLEKTRRWLFEALPVPDKEKEDAEFEKVFNKTKRISDFIGMIVRWSFAYFACLYFFQKAPDQSQCYRFVFGICGTMSLLLTIYFGIHINRLMQMYEQREAGRINRRAIRYPVGACWSSVACLC